MRSGNDSGQVTVLAIALLLGLLALLPIAVNISELLVAQQRLNAQADSAALAGALELEYNNSSACEVAGRFANISEEDVFRCVTSETDIQITIATRAPQSILNPFIQKLFASARAGIADTNSTMP